MIWQSDCGTYSVIRDRKEYHLFRCGKTIGTFRSLRDAQFRAENEMQEAEALADLQQQRERIKAAAAQRMGLQMTVTTNNMEGR